MKKSIWTIECAIKKTFKVAFDGNVSREEAMELFENDQYDDIIDEDENNINEVIEVIDAE